MSVGYGRRYDRGHKLRHSTRVKTELWNKAHAAIAIPSRVGQSIDRGQGRCSDDRYEYNVREGAGDSVLGHRYATCGVWGAGCSKLTDRHVG